MASGRSALIVATSRYADARLATLEGPARDAEALKGVLGARDIGGFDVRTVVNGRAARIRETLEAFLLDRARDDLLLIHFSGHGLKDDEGQLYLAATDTRLDRLMSTGIDASWVNRLMDRCRSERIGLFLDCCFAGAFTSAMTRRAGGDTAGVRDHFQGRGLVVITASDAMQYSFEGGRQVGEPPAPSPFSQALVDGLRTGDADRNEDGHVSINELFDYLEERIRETSPAQTPTKSAVNQTGDWVIARSTRVPSVRLLPERVQLLLRSEQPIDRLEAIIELQRVRSSPDARTAQAATAELRRLTADDSRRVAQRATEVLGDEPSVPATAEGVPVREAATQAPTRPRLEPTPVTPASDTVGGTAAAEPVPYPVEGTPVAEDAVVVDAAIADRVTGVEPTADAVGAAVPVKPMPYPGEGASEANAGGQVAAVSGLDAAADPSAGGVTSAPDRAALRRFGADVARGAARGLIGSLIGSVVGVGFALAKYTSSGTPPSKEIQDFIVGMVVGSTIVATLLEVGRLQLRLRRVPPWTAIAGNRWTESAIAGIVVGLLAARLNEGPALEALAQQASLVGALLIITIPQVPGFLIAEAIVGVVRPHPEPGSAAR